MIVVDTSAIIAIANNERYAPACIGVLSEHDEVLISAGTILEIIVVASRKELSGDVATLLAELLHTVVEVSEASAKRAGDAYTKWGKGFHPAGLNFGDCFAYELAKERNCPLLFVGNDFSKTDIVSALPAEDRA